MNCPVCSSDRSVLWATSTDVEYQTTTQEYRYLQCHCGVIFLDDPPVNQLSTIYPTSYYAYQSERSGPVFSVKHWRDIRKFRRVLSRLNHSSISVLDVGGGNGEVCNAIRSADNRVNSTTIVDLDVDLASYHTQTPHQYVCSRIEDFISETSFDVVVLINLIEHVANPRVILEKIRRIMSPDGLLIIHTPSTDSVDARLFRKSHWGGLHAPRHWVLFDHSTIRGLLLDSGFHDITIRNSQGAPFWAVSIIDLAHRLRIGHRSKQPIPSRRLFLLFLFVFACFDVCRASLGFRTSQMFITARPYFQENKIS